MSVNDKRTRELNRVPIQRGPVAYWMSRDQRASDNWALLHAQEIALKTKSPLAVIFCLVPDFLGATSRQYSFMIEGLKLLEKDLKEKNIPFFVLSGDPAAVISDFIKKNSIAVLVSDFDPLKIKLRWKKDLLKDARIPFLETDSHNIVPCWLASGKPEFAAYTFRPKINHALDEFLEEFPALKRHPYGFRRSGKKIDWSSLSDRLKMDTTVSPVRSFVPGEGSAKALLRSFIGLRLKDYPEKRNDPAQQGQSGLSPYIHFGQISSQRIALEVIKSKAPHRSKDVFLEELVVRKELADNYCFYNQYYDDPKGLPEWAKNTLLKHRTDKREFLYSREQLEYFRTHDELWNASQRQLVVCGKMHGYMRMYWAKKILEWTHSAAEAQDIAIYLNDKYELDGRDPCGYTGIAWSIGGLHDRPWFERRVFGQIRYMSYNGARSKFDVDAYIKKVSTDGL